MRTHQSRCFSILPQLYNALTTKNTPALTMLLTMLLALWNLPIQVVADDGEMFFEKSIRPLLTKHCADCHSEDYSEGGFRVDTATHFFKGGNSGESPIAVGKPESSLLIDALSHKNKKLKMPPDEKLADKEIQLLTKWIKIGAPWPGAGKAVRAGSHITDADRNFWSFKPIARPKLPKVSNPAWPKKSIDHFILAKLDQHQLSPAKPASRRVLIRRLYHDMLGLPPSPKAINAFEKDTSPHALEKLVDQLLASPQYGERWGRHWLDIARYADTQGDVADYPIPWAWKYRNWVYQAIGDDLPIDQFLRWQVAGDLIARNSTADQVDHKRFRDMHFATGFISLSRRFGQFSTGKEHLVIEDTIDAFGRGMLGLTMRCARCHNHKFDPILATDYYSLYGMFQSTRYPTAGNATDRMPRRLVALSRDPADQKKVDDYWDEVQRQHTAGGKAGGPRFVKLYEEYQQLKKQADQPSATAQDKKKFQSFMQKNELLREAFEKGRKYPRQRWTYLLQNPPKVEMAFAVVDKSKVTDARLHRFGQPDSLGSMVPRKMPEVIDIVNEQDPPKGQSGRQQLADWLTAPDNPLTARVFVNRVWQWHLGQGLVRTPDNFGKLGEAPTHPELLDWLAYTFVHEDKWSLKKLHRRILLSQTYLQSSDVSTEAEKTDPDNRWLSHFSRRRLDAESVRDAMLLASGELDLTPKQEHNLNNLNGKFYRQYTLNYPFNKFFDDNKRSCYQLVARLNKHPLLGLFDGPDRNQSTSQRTAASTPTQALYLLNSPWVKQRSENFARRLQRDAKDPTEQIKHAVLLTWGRPVTEEELKTFTQFLVNYQSKFDKKSRPQQRTLALSALCRVLLTSNEFFFVD